jgi:hypothetical protein
MPCIQLLDKDIQRSAKAFKFDALGTTLLAVSFSAFFSGLVSPRRVVTAK